MKFPFKKVSPQPWYLSLSAIFKFVLFSGSTHFSGCLYFVGQGLKEPGVYGITSCVGVRGGISQSMKHYDRKGCVGMTNYYDVSQ